MNTKIVGIVTILILLMAGVWWFVFNPQHASYDFQFVQGESIDNWSFKGAYTGDAELEAKAQSEIKRQKGRYGNPENDPTDYIINVGIANQYELLGDGQMEFEYLMYALAIDAKNTGLAWHNLGKLLERLGAYKSALLAYDAAVAAQSTRQYQFARLEFLKAHMPENTEAIEEAEERLRNTSDVILE